jgi:hypothetical protein
LVVVVLGLDHDHYGGGYFYEKKRQRQNAGVSVDIRSLAVIGVEKVETGLLNENEDGLYVRSSPLVCSIIKFSSRSAGR